MNRITNITAATKRHLATAAIRQSWAIIPAARSGSARGNDWRLALGTCLEAWAHRLAERWDCVDDALDTLTNEALGH